MSSLPNSPYLIFDREDWAALRDSEPMTLSEEEIEMLKGIDDDLSIDEVTDIYLPLSRLLTFFVSARINRQMVMRAFLKEKREKIPFIISIGGSVSVGKSTTARVLQALLSKRSEHANVELITTDGFLYPNSVLEEKGLMLKKGFPQSYDIKRLLQFVKDVKSGKGDLLVPEYSHRVYDIIPDKFTRIHQPDILILEGLNVLQSGMDYPSEKPRVFVSDYVDFSIYVEAEEKLLEEWYLSRFMKFRKKAENDAGSYFHGIAGLSDKDALRMAKTAWREINRKNLRRNIHPSRERANLILHKGKDHQVDFVKLRK